jgi:hypothetical protein
LQEGQIMIEGWLDVSYPADYPARLNPSASNICAIASKRTAQDVIFQAFAKLIRDAHAI